MALIELNLEKPALKRTELLTEEETVESTETTESTEESIDTIDAESEETEEAEELEAEEETETSGRSAPRKFARRVAILGGTAAGLAAARKFQKRRGKSAEAEQEFEEDWQTAE